MTDEVKRRFAYYLTRWPEDGWVNVISSAMAVEENWLLVLLCLDWICTGVVLYGHTVARKGGQQMNFIEFQWQRLILWRLRELSQWHEIFAEVNHSSWAKFVVHFLSNFQHFMQTLDVCHKTSSSRRIYCPWTNTPLSDATTELVTDLTTTSKCSTSYFMVSQIVRLINWLHLN